MASRKTGAVLARETVGPNTPLRLNESRSRTHYRQLLRPILLVARQPQHWEKYLAEASYGGVNV